MTKSAGVCVCMCLSVYAYACVRPRTFVEKYYVHNLDK